MVLTIYYFTYSVRLNDGSAEEAGRMERGGNDAASRGEFVPHTRFNLNGGLRTSSFALC